MSGQWGGAVVGAVDPGCSSAGKGHKNLTKIILTTTEVSLRKLASTVAYRNRLLAILLNSRPTVIHIHLFGLLGQVGLECF